MSGVWVKSRFGLFKYVPETIISIGNLKRCWQRISMFNGASTLKRSYSAKTCVNWNVRVLIEIRPKKKKEIFAKTDFHGPSFSGHSQERPPSLMWPQSFGAATMTSLMWPQFLGKLGGLIRGGLLYTVSSNSHCYIYSQQLDKSATVPWMLLSLFPGMYNVIRILYIEFVYNRCHCRQAT